MSAGATLYTVDASIYVFRGWFTLPDSLTDSAGNPINAVIGFVDFLTQLCNDHRPLHLVCAFDESLTSSWRNDLYPEYKANRESAPEELKFQFRLCRELVAASGLREFASPLLEADDIIATLARNARAQGFRNVVVSADKDLTQVLRDDDEWWDYAKNTRLSVTGVEKKFGVKPEQIGDLLALAGDKVDNIPGVPGIGMKTAARLLVKWGDIPNLLHNVERVAEMQMRGAKRVGDLLAEHSDSLHVTRQITATRHDPELPVQMSELARRKPDSSALGDVFERLSFGTPRRERWLRALAARA
ncbi:MAG: flap endonuclease [Gammaproteobacteria bacterium]|nr:flap endonuclease [Gammaproteobacteria bacterium]